MEHKPDPPSGWRGSPEIWLQAAYEALISGGIEAVKILPLATKLSLARTSFYWHFRDREDLLAALARRWTGRTSTPLIAATESYAGTEAEALLNVIGCFLDPDGFDDRLEFAVRGWALGDAVMLEKLRAEDALRLSALAAMLGRWGHGPEDADTRARAIYMVQIGYIAMQERESLATRMARIPHYVRIYGGRAEPTEPELARFHARLGYRPEAG